MNKADKSKMTFRFSSGQGQEVRDHKSNVIPLRPDEYRLYEDSSIEAAPSSADQRTEVEAEASEFTPPAQKGTVIKPLNDFHTDFGGWQSSFDLEVERVEQAIRSTGGADVNPETGLYQRETRTGRGGYGYSEREVIVDEQLHYSRPPGGGSFLKITASVAGAVVTGVAFGFLVLSMFAGGEEGDPLKPAIQTGSTAQQGKTAAGSDAGAAAQGSAAEAKAGQSGAAVSGLEAGDAVAVNLPMRSYTFLQGGVFSTAQSSESEAAAFRKKGLAAVSEAGDKYTLFVGMASSRDEALGLSQFYENQSIDVMLKPYEIPAVSSIRWSGKQPEQFVSYMDQGSKLVQQIAAQTVVHAAETEATPIDEKALQTIKSTHQAWAKSASTVGEGLGEAGKTALPKMNSALNTAVVSLEEYRKNPSSSLIWQAQTALMQYLVAEKELLKTVTVS
ncbi:hypothetical protein [Paenibacillus sp. YYML68]|uniref:hypothetical protein n=1 Tax=Paenibacillus sp. YYML68 TaxID=2909250 RepID=UPI002490F9B3|nr:hypothetical protein [Paenibacillus sp. YYML68]